MLQSLLPEAVEGVMVSGAGWLLTYLLHSTILLGGAWMLDRWSRVGASPRLQSWLWTGALAAGIVTASVASMGWSASAVRLTVTEAEKAILEFPARGSERPAAAQQEAANQTETSPEGASLDGNTAASATGFTSPYRSELTNPAAWWQSLGHDWPYLLFLASAATAMAILLGRGFRLWTFFGSLRSRETVDSGPLRDALDGLTYGETEAREISLSLSGELASPVALPGGEICVPSRALEELEEGEMEALLAHELAHLRRGDPVALLALAVLEALLAVQPLNRVARRRLISAAERRIDERVRRLGLGAELASTLVTVAQWIRGRRTRSLVAGLAEHSELETRVRSLLDGPGSSAQTPVRVAASMIAGGVVVLGAVTLLSPTARLTTSPHPPHLGHESGDIGRESVYCAPPTASASVRGGEVCTSEAGLTTAARRELADGRGVGLYVEVEADDREFSLRLRPGGTSVRWYTSAGRRLVLPMPREAPDGAVATLGVSAPEADEHVLYLPPSVRRLMVVVNGRVVQNGRLSRGGGWPRLVGPDEGDGAASS